VASTPPPTPALGSPPGGDGQIHPATFLQLCDRWPDDADGDPITCDDLVRTALNGMPAADQVTRIDTSYSCATSCRPLDADRGYAIVRSGSEAFEIEIARQADGTVAVTGATPFAPPDAPPFDDPAVSAPAVDGAPAGVNERVPLPLCGVEAGSAYGPFDEEARQCFWDGVRAGSPVEFIESHPDTEGLLTTTIYRFGGTGGVEVLSNDEGGWKRMYTGVGPALEDGRVFDVDGLSDTQRLPAP